MNKKLDFLEVFLEKSRYPAQRRARGGAEPFCYKNTKSLFYKDLRQMVSSRLLSRFTVLQRCDTDTGVIDPGVKEGVPRISQISRTFEQIPIRDCESV
jgi:hypothetical protein